MSGSRSLQAYGLSPGVSNTCLDRVAIVRFAMLIRNPVLHAQQ